MRKVYLTVNAAVQVPMLVQFKAIVTVDDNCNIGSVARAVMGERKKMPSSATLEDSSIESVQVNMEGAEEVEDLLDQVHDYIESPGSYVRYEGYTVDDSK